jgi:16S rRNA (guanine527-N7)-methyltransferase
MSNNTDFKKLIARWSPNFAPEKLELFARFLGLLSKWNKAYNLTAIRQPEEMVTLHLFDSLSVAPYLHGTRTLDVGTGAGLPGIPLAISHPEKEFVLLDSNQKKITFCQQVVLELKLQNVELVYQRAEQFIPPLQFDTILSRAFASISDMLKNSSHLCAAGGRFLAMKGVAPKEDLSEIAKHYRCQVQELKVLGVNAERCVVLIEQQN